MGQPRVGIDIGPLASPRNDDERREPLPRRQRLWNTSRMAGRGHTTPPTIRAAPNSQIIHTEHQHVATSAYGIGLTPRRGPDQAVRAPGPQPALRHHRAYRRAARTVEQVGLHFLGDRSEQHHGRLPQGRRDVSGGDGLRPCMEVLAPLTVLVDVLERGRARRTGIVDSDLGSQRVEGSKRGRARDERRAQTKPRSRAGSVGRRPTQAVAGRRAVAGHMAYGNEFRAGGGAGLQW